MREERNSERSGDPAIRLRRMLSGRENRSEVYIPSSRKIGRVAGVKSNHLNRLLIARLPNELAKDFNANNNLYKFSQEQD